MSEIKRRAFGKINLFLRILSAEGDYHTIESLQQTVDLFDEITLTKRADDKITSDFPNDNSIPVLTKIAETYSLGGMHLSVKKQLPIGGGIGGSTADAAAAALACAELWGLNPLDVRALVAPMFGDLAFQMTGGTAITRGRGEIVLPLPPLLGVYVLLAFPKKGVSTKDAYRLSDDTPRGKGDLDGLYRALAERRKAQDYYLNDLLPAAETLNDEIAPLLQEIGDENALLTGMSGSGSTVFSLYANLDDAIKKCKALALPALVTRTLPPILTK